MTEIFRPGWRPGICHWCENVALVTTLVRTKRRKFCTSCLDNLAKATEPTAPRVAQDAHRMAGF